MKNIYIASIMVFGFALAFIGAFSTSETITEMTRNDPLPTTIYVLGIAFGCFAMGMAINNKEEE